ncbi:MAG: hypothetical protein EAZ07_04300 [Cytophagales bacterium]|nr:MAG: hypothetical protein EAZ07_04300 [Cytophagales bacterium]
MFKYKNYISCNCFIFLFFTFFSCKQSKDSLNTQNRSTVFYADEMCKPILEAERFIFEAKHPDVKLEIRYGSEHFVLNHLNFDSSRLYCMIRSLDSIEVKRVFKKTYTTKSIKIADDAIACVVSRKSKSNTIHLDSLNQIISNTNTKQARVLVVMQAHIGIFAYLKQKYKSDAIQKNIFSVPDSLSLMNYLANNQNAIGLVPINWIGQNINKDIQHDLKIISITLSSGLETMPDQLHLSEGKYPLAKGIYCNLIGSMSDDASNFVNFCRNEVGQMIVLNSGQQPVIMPSREFYTKE